MSLVKYSRDVLLADGEDDPSAGGVDNAIILYRAIEKDRMCGVMGWGTEGGWVRRRKDILWSPGTIRER